MTLAERIGAEAIRDYWAPEMLIMILNKFTPEELQRYPKFDWENPW